MRKAFLVVALLATGAYGAEAPVVPELSKLRLIAAYSKAVLLQNQFLQAQQAAQAAARTFNEIQDKERATLGLPVGTTFNIDLDKQDVTIIPAPARPQEKK